MRSLASILSGETLTLANLKDLQLLIEKINDSFGGKDKEEVSIQTVAQVLSEMLPSEGIEALSERLNKGLHKQSLEFNMKDLGLVLASLAIAVQQKRDINSGKIKSISDEISELKNQETKSPNKKTSAQIRELQNIINVAKKIEAHTTDSRISRIRVKVKTLNDLITSLPSYIRNFPVLDDDKLGIAGFLRELNSRFHQLIDTQVSSTDESKITSLCKLCEEDCNLLVIKICAAIGLRINEQHAEISAAGINKINADYGKLTGFLGALSQAENQEDVYEEIAEKFKELVNTVVSLSNQLPDTRAEAEYRRKEDLANMQITEEFPPEEFSFFLMPGDLRASHNDFVTSQTDISKKYFGEIEDRNKFILCGQPSKEETKNLFQIRKDAKREHLIQGKSYKGNKMLTMANADALLRKEFGDENAMHAMTHFDQGASLILGGGVAKGVAPQEELMEEFPLALKQPEAAKGIEDESKEPEEKVEDSKHQKVDLRSLEESRLQALEAARKRKEPPPVTDQNLYMKNDGVLYRSVRLNYFTLSVPTERKDELDNSLWKLEEPEVWTLKVNIKSLYWASKDGFVEVCTATNNPVICNALMKNSDDLTPKNSPTPHEQLLALVALVLAVEKDANAELQRIRGNPEAFEEVDLKDSNDEKEPASPLSPASALSARELNLLSKEVTLESVLRQIKDFKEGKHTFDDLVSSVEKISMQALGIKHVGEWTSFFKKMGYDRASTTARVIGDMSTKLSALKKKLDDSASVYKRENNHLMEAPDKIVAPPPSPVSR